MFQHGVPYCRPHHAGCRPRHWQDGLQPGVAVCWPPHNPSQPSASRVHIPRAVCVRGACSLNFTNISYPFYMLNILWLFNAFFFHHGVDVRRCISGNANFIWKTVVCISGTPGFGIFALHNYRLAHGVLCCTPVAARNSFWHVCHIIYFISTFRKFRTKSNKK